MGKGVLFREVSSFQGLRVVLGVGKGVLFREVSSVRGCPYRGVPLYILSSQSRGVYGYHDW